MAHAASFQLGCLLGFPPNPLPVAAPAALTELQHVPHHLFLPLWCYCRAARLPRWVLFRVACRRQQPSRAGPPAALLRRRICHVKAAQTDQPLIPPPAIAIVCLAANRRRAQASGRERRREGRDVAMPARLLRHAGSLAHFPRLPVLCILKPMLLCSLQASWPTLRATVRRGAILGSVPEGLPGLRLKKGNPPAS